jgi:hypothetical protein
MCGKWKAWVTNSMTVIKQSPDLADHAREHPINCNFLPKVCTPSTKDWPRKFFFKNILKDLPSKFNEFKSVVLAHDQLVESLALMKTKRDDPAAPIDATEDDNSSMGI